VDLVNVLFENWNRYYDPSIGRYHSLTRPDESVEPQFGSGRANEVEIVDYH
jgi:hypothetical protein